MIYIYRRQSSTSAQELVYAVPGRRARTFPRLLRAVGDHIVCWGETAPPGWPGHCPLLNGAPFQSKFQDALKLKEAGVATIEVSRTRPVQPVLAPEPIYDPGGYVTMNRARVQTYVAELVEWLRLNPEPIPAQLVEWLGRTAHHVGGTDLLTPPEQPDYYSRKENLNAEFRVHSFLGRSIRSGKKVCVPNPPSHPWVRSLLGGWKISYDGVSVRQRHRDLAHAAVKALGLDFGAVDLGERPDGSLIVLEVNRAPGLDGGTITAYAEAIRRWAENG